MKSGDAKLIQGAAFWMILAGCLFFGPSIVRSRTHAAPECGISCADATPGREYASRQRAGAEVPEDLQALINAFKSTSLAVHQQAAAKLTAMGDRAAVVIPALIDILGMGTFHWDGMDAQGRMTGGSIAYSDTAEMILVKIGKPAVAPLLKYLADSAKRGAAAADDARSSVIRVLGKLKDQRAVDPMIQALNDKSTAVRAAAAQALLEFTSPEVSDRLAKVMKSGNADLRDGATWVLIRKKDARVLPLLKDRLNSPYHDVREDAVRDLALFGDAQSMQALVACLGKDPDLRVRVEAARALGEIGNAEAVEPLMQSLQSGDTDLCLASVHALGKLKDPRAVPLIERLLQDVRPGVREAAASALKSIKEKTAGEANENC